MLPCVPILYLTVNCIWLKGAGTLLEALRMNRKIVTVVNEKLMDNHQVYHHVMCSYRWQQV
jgi:hypothetical protein